MIPQLILTLSPTGQLVLERPMAGSRQTIPLSPGTLESTAHRILLAQLRSEYRLGEDGLPTTAQVNHWNRHANHTDPSCSFCQSELQLGDRNPPHRAPRKFQQHVGNGTATVHHLPPSIADQRHLPRKLSSNFSADDLGL